MFAGEAAGLHSKLQACLFVKLKAQKHTFGNCVGLYLLPAHEALVILIVVVKGKKVIKIISVICKDAGQQPVPADPLELCHKRRCSACGTHLHLGRRRRRGLPTSFRNCHCISGLRVPLGVVADV